MVNKKWIVTSYIGDFSWIEKYTDNYIVYDKSGSLEETEKIKHQPNVGYNIYDIAYFIVNNYDNLPDVCVFVKSNAFKHCQEKTFEKLIQNNSFTPIEDYSYIPPVGYHTKDTDGGYMELNNSWYISSHVSTYGVEVNKYFKNYNDFLNEMFANPTYPIYIRFSPGGQYIVPKERILFYSKKFWEKIMGYVSYNQIPSEAHVFERMLYYIFTNKWREK